MVSKVSVTSGNVNTGANWSPSGAALTVQDTEIA